MQHSKGLLLKGAMWLVAARVLINLTTLASAILLARWLSPDDFGLAAIASAVSLIALSITDLSLNQALIQNQDLSEDDFHAAWTLSLIRAIFLAVVLLGLALPLAWIYRDERLVPILAVFAGATFISALENPKLVVFQRGLVFSQDFAITVAEKLAGFIAAIAIAYVYRSYWALVLGAVASQLVRVAVSYTLIGYRPRLSLARSRPLLSFTIWLTLGKIMQTVNARSVPLFIGLFSPTSIVGQYSLGDRLARMPLNEAVGAVQKALFPAFAQMQRDRGRLEYAYGHSQAMICTLAFPLGAAIALFAEPIVVGLIGEKWLPAVPIIQILAVVSAAASIQNVRPLAMATGHTKEIFHRDFRALLVQAPLLIGGLLAGRATGRELIGVGLAIGCGTAINALWNLQLVRKVARISLRTQLALGLRPAAATLVMVAAIVALRLIFHARAIETAGWGGVIVLGVAGGIAYLGALFALWSITGRRPGPEAEVLALGAMLKQRVGSAKPGRAGPGGRA